MVLSIVSAQHSISTGVYDMSVSFHVGLGGEGLPTDGALPGPVFGVHDLQVAVPVPVGLEDLAADGTCGR